MRILCISDLHMGNGLRGDDFGDNDTKLLKWIWKMQPHEVILVGDIFELWQFKMRRS